MAQIAPCPPLLGTLRGRKRKIVYSSDEDNDENAKFSVRDSDSELILSDFTDIDDLLLSEKEDTPEPEPLHRPVAIDKLQPGTHVVVDLSNVLTASSPVEIVLVANVSIESKGIKEREAFAEVHEAEEVPVEMTSIAMKTLKGVDAEILMKRS
ncbi:hypothetical protein J6590_096441 [Homalodisca vitripennis]|nr:hypothetical protein J6590_096441 [Homalodisca vitripennis]